jgi:glycerol-3-phosphate dehydrogenase (NAD(P)+)
MSDTVLPMKITIIGAGSWGTAMAIHCAKINNEVTLCAREESQAVLLNSARENKKYLPGIIFPQNLHIGGSWRNVFKTPHEENHLLLIATPYSGLQGLAREILDFGFFPKYWLWLCKGIDPLNGLLPHQVIADVFKDYANSLAIMSGMLSGPSFAIEVAKGLPCALTVASQNPELGSLTQSALHHGNMRIYATSDIVGVELGGAIKNILAIATGIADGLDLGLNARAALITRGMAEMTRLGIALGAKTETFSGLTGLGDLILTSTGDLSRNRRVGLALAQGKNLEEILNNLGHVAEGVRCAKAVQGLAASAGVEMPIVSAVVKVLNNEFTPLAAVAEIMARDARQE